MDIYRDQWAECIVEDLKRRLEEKEMIIEKLYDLQPALCLRISELQEEVDDYHRHKGSVPQNIDEIEERINGKLEDEVDSRDCICDQGELRMKQKVLQKELWNISSTKAPECWNTIAKCKKERDFEPDQVRQLQEALRAAQERNRKLCDKLESGTSTDSSCCKHLQQTVTVLRDKVEGLEQKVRNTKSDVKASQNETNGQAEFAELQRQNEEEANQKLTTLKLKNKNLESQLNAAVEKERELEDELVAANDNQKILRTKLKGLEEDMRDAVDMEVRKHRKSIGECEEQRNAAHAKERQLQKKIADLQEQIEKDQTDQRKLRNKLSDLDWALSAAKDDCRKKDVMLNALDAEKDDETQRLQKQLRTVATDLEEKMESEQVNERKYRNLMEECEAERDAALETERKLQRQIAQFNEKLEENAKETTKLRMRVGELEIAADADQKSMRSKMKMLEDELQDAAEAELRKVRNEIDECGEERDAALARERQLQRKITDLEEEIRTENNKIHKLRDQVGDLEQELSQADEENRRNRAVIAVIDAEKEDCGSNGNQLRTLIAGIERERDECLSSQRNLRKKLSELNEEKEEGSKKLSQLRRLNNELADESQLLRTQLTELREGVDTEVRKLRISIEQYEKDKNEGIKEIGKLQNRVNELVNELKYQLAVKDENGKALTAFRSKIKALKEEMENASKAHVVEAENLQNALTNCEEERDAALDRERELRRKVSKLERDITMGQSQLRKAQKNVTDLKDKMTTLQIQKEEELQELMAIIQDIREEHDKLEQKWRFDTEQQLQKQIEEFNRERAATDNKMKDLKEEMRDAVDIEVRKHRKSIGKSEEQRNAALAKERQLQKKIADLQGQIDKDQTDQRKLRNKLSDLDRELSAAKDDCRKKDVMLNALDAEKEDETQRLQKQLRTVATDLEEKMESEQVNERKYRNLLHECEAERDAALERERKLQRQTAQSNEKVKEGAKETNKFKKSAEKLRNKLAECEAERDAALGQQRQLEAKISDLEAATLKLETKNELEHQKMLKIVQDIQQERDTLEQKRQRAERALISLKRRSIQGQVELVDLKRLDSIIAHQHINDVFSTNSNVNSRRSSVLSRLPPRNSVQIDSSPRFTESRRSTRRSSYY